MKRNNRTTRVHRVVNLLCVLALLLGMLPAPLASPWGASVQQVEAANLAPTTPVPVESAGPSLARPSVQSASYRDEVLADSPLGYWRLGETSGTVAADSSGNGRNGTLVNSPQLGQPGALLSDSDPSMAFYGSWPGGQRVQLPTGFADFSSGLTLEAWVYPTGTPDWGRILVLGNDYTDNISLSRMSWGTDLGFSVCNGSNCSPWITAPSVLGVNKWVYLVVTMDATGLVKIYVDGLRVVTAQSNVLPANITRSYNQIGMAPGFTYAFGGSIDEAAVYAGALPQSRVEAHFAASGRPTTPPLPQPSAYQSAVLTDSPTGYWRLGEESGAVARDLASSGNNGAITGGVSRGDGALVVDGDKAMGIYGSWPGAQRVGLQAGFANFSNGLTLEAWVYPTEANHNGGILALGNDPADNITLARHMTTDELRFNVCNGTTCNPNPLIGYGALQLNRWLYVVATLDPAGNAALYVDGWPVATGQFSVLPASVTRWNNSIGTSASQTFSFGGRIDEAAVYDYPLSQERIVAHFAASGRSTALESWGQELTHLGQAYRGESQDPVDTGSGVFTYSHTDLAIAGRGPTPTFARSYNSAASTVGPLGPGWTHNYFTRLVHDASGKLAIVSPGGRYDVYTPIGNGAFSPPAGVDSTLSQDLATGSFSLQHKDGSAWAFDMQGRLTAIADRHGNQSILGYNTNSQLVSVSDPAGRGSLSFAYDTCYTGRLCSISDWLVPARSVGFEYDASGRLWQVTDREGKVTTYGYEGTTSRLTTITDARGNVAVTNTYDAQGRVSTQKDARGLVTGEQTTFNYVTNPDGTKTTTVTYPATSHDPNWDFVQVDNYDAQGRLTSRLSKPTANSADDITNSYTYDANSFRTSATDGRGNMTDYCYDTAYDGAAIAGSRGNLTRLIGPAVTVGVDTVRPVTLYQYDAKNNLIQTVPPKGVSSGATVTCATDLSGAINSQYVVDNTYDTATQTKLLASAVRYTDPDLGAQTAVTKFEYTDAANPGLVTKVIPPRGNTGPTPDYTYATTNTYFTTGSKAGMLQSVADPLGNVTTYDYDAVGRRTSMVDPNGNATGANPTEHTWTYEYDRKDHLRFSRAPAPQVGGSALVSESRYDEVGNKVVAIDANGQVTKYTYDERNSLKEVRESPAAWTDPAVTPSPQYLTEYQYDHLGNLSRVTRAKGDSTYERATDYAYDGLNRLRKETQYPSWPSTSGSLLSQYTYDKNGNRATMVDPLSQTTTYAYDALNLLTGVTYSDGQTPSVTYTYDLGGNRLSMVDGTGTTDYTYDEANRPLSVTSPGPKVVGYRYDLDGNRVKVIYPDSTAVTYTFDKGSRLGSLSDWASRSTGYEYNPDGSLKTVTNFNGTTAIYTSDNALRLTDVWNKQSTNTISRHTYTLDAAGNRTQVEEALPQLGAPGDHTAVVVAWAWGANASGQLGDGTTSGHTSPSRVNTLSGVTAAAGGGSHSLALKSDGTVWAWGSNSNGQLGDNTTTQRPGPVQVKGQGGSGFLTGVTAIAAGTSHSLALKADGTVWAWGANGSGQLGDNSTSQRNAPVQVSGLTGVSAIAAGGPHSLALLGDGTVRSWGENGSGQLGNGATKDSSVPVQPSNLAGVSAIAAGANHSLAVKATGTAWAWGANGAGQLGDNSTTQRKSPVQVLNLTGVSAVRGGDLHSLALKSNGSVWAWGSNTYGQLGDNSTSQRNTAMQVQGQDGVGFLTGIATITAGGNHSLALPQSSGTFWAWGNNTIGQLGASTSTTCGTYACSKTPVAPSTPAGASAVGGGSSHSLAVAPAGSTTIAYGYDRLYRLTTVTTPGANSTYAYDPVGNRTSLTRSSATTYTYDRADRITAAGATSYTVNANGNLTARGADTFTYDQANRLKTAGVGSTPASYVYDGDGKRTSKTVSGNTTSYIYDANRSLPVVLDDGARKYVWGHGLVYTVEGTAALVYHTDGLASIRAITDGSDQVVQTYMTDEYGVSTESQGTSSQPFGYTGEQGDGEAGLVYLRARYYDPSAGRFISRDPFPGLLLVPQTVNGYPYVVNNPTNLTDPGGRIAPALVGLAIIAWQAFEVVSSAADAVATAQTLADPEASAKEKISTVGLFVVGLYSPGGGAAAIRRLPFKDPDRILEVNRTLDRIESGGPFPYSKDGTVWGNYKAQLPQHESGYYKEYTVDTPGSQTRGTRRIVQGQGGETFYTDDHYGTFVQIDPAFYWTSSNASVARM